MREKKLIPKRRFKEFNEEWKALSFDEFLNVNSGRDYKHLNEGNIPVYGTGGLMLHVDDKLSGEDSIGIGRKGTIDRPQLLKAPFWTVDTLFFMTPHNKANLYFLFSKSQTIDWRKMDESTGVPSLSKKTIEKLQINMTCLKEQQKIGEFFKHLDQMITLEQRKLEKTKALKSAYLAEMFPAEGERVPKRRFKRFVEEWEEFTFNNLLDISEGIRRGPFGSALKKEYFVSDSSYVVYEQQNAIYDRYNTRYNITKEKYEELYRFRIKQDDFIMSGAGTIGRISRVPKGLSPGVINQALIRLRINEKSVDSDYFLQWMRSGEMQAKLTEANPASAMVNLVPMSEVKQWNISIPKLEEQQAIGEFFKKLDDSITNQQQKLNKLIAMKQAYLQEMFV